MLDERVRDVLVRVPGVRVQGLVQVLRDAVDAFCEELFDLVRLKVFAKNVNSRFFFGSDTLAITTSSMSSSASSTRSGRMLLLALSRSIFRRLEMEVFTAVWYSSSTCVRCWRVSYNHEGC